MMINRELVLKKYNDMAEVTEGMKKIRDRNGDVTAAFLDLGAEGVTTEMMVYAIDNCYVHCREDLLSADYIKACQPVDVEAVPVTEPTPKANGDNPFAMFETMIAGVVGTQAKPIIDNMLDAWVKSHERELASITREVVWTCEERKGEVTEATHETFDDIAEMVRRKRYPLLVGPAGSGKNHTAMQIAKLYNLDFYFTGSVMQVHELMGFVDANGHYHETQFYKWAVNGGLFLFDEMDNSDPEILKKFNAGLANGYVDFPTGRVNLHPDCRVIAAANTWGTGASAEYVGNQIDASTLDRFMPIWFDYDARVEESLTHDMGLLDFIRTFRKACDEYGIHALASYRAISNCEEFRDVFGYEKTLRYAVIKNMEADDVRMMVDKFATKSDEWSKAFVKIAKAA